MKSVLIVALIVFSAYSASTWEGNWKVIQGWPGNCCCPAVGNKVEIQSDPKNASQILISTTFNGNNVCNNMHWENDTQIAWPWPATPLNLNTRTIYVGEQALTYLVYPYQLLNGTVIGAISINEMSVKGGVACLFQLSNAASSEELEEDSFEI